MRPLRTWTSTRQRGGVALVEKIFLEDKSTELGHRKTALPANGVALRELHEGLLSRLIRMFQHEDFRHILATITLRKRSRCASVLEVKPVCNFCRSTQEHSGPLSYNFFFIDEGVAGKKRNAAAPTIFS